MTQDHRHDRRALIAARKRLDALVGELEAAQLAQVRRSRRSAFSAVSDSHHPPTFLPHHAMLTGAHDCEVFRGHFRGAVDRYSRLFRRSMARWGTEATLGWIEDAARQPPPLPQSKRCAVRTCAFYRLPCSGYDESQCGARARSDSAMSPELITA